MRDMKEATLPKNTHPAIAASWFKTVDKGTSDSTRKVMLGLFIWRHYQVLRKGIRTETTLRHSWKGRHGNHIITIPYTE